ncbi:N-acetyltransferase domain-containing protein [Favolaschia claudopus]|uniref:N-acetyltransferase domain-containing protein n=1 Tax=Favolaschia claudopus TaxID=2862362 RepID=A0AAW0CWT2_9AGAR
MSRFRVRKIDPPPASHPSELKNLPEMRDVEKVLVRAFSEDIFAAVVTGHDPQIPSNMNERLGSFFMSNVIAGLMGGEVYVAEALDTQEIIGCAVWFGPGRAMFDSEDQQEHALKPFMSALGSELETWWIDYFLPAYDAFVDSVLGKGTKLGAWHLQLLGVDPAYHRQGAARLLLETVIKRAHAAEPPIPLVVETPAEVDIEIYTKLGFHLMPTGKDIQSCKSTYIGATGDVPALWVLIMD